MTESPKEVKVTAEEMKKISESEVKDFVQDKFFQKGNWWLKIRQVLVNVAFLAILLLPIMILFNSLTNKQIWKNLYAWTYQDGFELTDYLKSSILLAFVVVLVLSLGFLYRNNYREQNVYPKKKTYDEEMMNRRKEVLNKMYTERFGEQEFRETTKYYAVDGEQNLDDHLVDGLFKEAGVEIK
ncbi:hypothetical protein SAMN02745116_01794 [Pilibacter termitis]|uniref:Uncharacterized protein n=1 Tax=Pilibacter termitis TaxID=263852 RepID=A0A1T4PG78_9ENTE|nr:hypothetical protein [Pilibacter termitis]SJZ90327.1 hypothetical protein SAMN02745116_01794 [Pilibacter termitis]